MEGGGGQRLNKHKQKTLNKQKQTDFFPIISFCAEKRAAPEAFVREAAPKIIC